MPLVPPAGCRRPSPAMRQTVSAGRRGPATSAPPSRLRPLDSVLAMAPWLPETGAGAGADGSEGAEGAEGAEPVKHLLGRQVLLVHGTNDARTDPELSFRLAERAKKTNRDTCRFEVHSDGHALRQHRAEVTALAADFVCGSLFGRAYARPVADALAAPPPLGLRMPLAAGFGKSLRG
ncbi:prolyl oligopeptidase family serine peptidase [Streptomyces sp. NPDC127117]|uniref:prolyl oligopeptidase family serine peptidase n=1 Tax=Streptomyces sp. NPDC127117 TaxID=3345368 RepID=UPI003629017A